MGRSLVDEAHTTASSLVRKPIEFLPPPNLTRFRADLQPDLLVMKNSFGLLGLPLSFPMRSSNLDQGAAEDEPEEDGGGSVVAEPRLSSKSD